VKIFVSRYGDLFDYVVCYGRYIGSFFRDVWGSVKNVTKDFRLDCLNFVYVRDFRDTPEFNSVCPRGFYLGFINY